MSSHLIIGPPGTGKTTYLINKVKEFSRRLPLSKVGYISFTRRAVREAIDRALGDDVASSRQDLPYFRTIHSLALYYTSHVPDELMKHHNYQELGDLLGLEFTGRQPTADMTVGSHGDQLLFVENLSRISRSPLDEIWRRLNLDISYHELVWFTESYKKYKQSTGMLDFTDLLEEFLKVKEFPRLRYVLVDEAQDLSRLQWEIVERLCAESEDAWLAGDDDQSIFTWAGADVSYFIDREFDEVEVLQQSHRVPASVHQMANELINRISHRRKKHFRATDITGELSYEAGTDDIDFSEGKWLVLVRNNYQLSPIVDLMRRHGYHYGTADEESFSHEALEAAFTWEKLLRGEPVLTGKASAMLKFISIAKFKEKQRPHLSDAGAVTLIDLLHTYGLQVQGKWHQVLDRISDNDREFFIAASRHGEHLGREPRIQLSTIHGAKGAEADCVAVMTDLSRRTCDSMAEDPDAETRVFYVAVTRAKKRLHIIQPQTQNFFPI